MTGAGAHVGRLATFGISAAASFALALYAYDMSFHAARLGVVLLALLVMHLVRFASVVLARETLVYCGFLAYMFLELLWTEDRTLALNTLVPATTFVIVMMLFASLAVFHDLKAVLAGAVTGILAGGALYSAVSGFPFKYPDEFSYNAIASMFLFDSPTSLLLASVARWKALYFALAIVMGILIVATTSIKTNVGVLLGTLVVGAVHFGQVSRLLWRNALVIVVAAVALSFAVVSNQKTMASLERGINRVALGIEILRAREERPGYSSFELRASWQREGFRGWSENPMFGHGVEAFRSKYGITSHATHVDIAYNSGLIGLALLTGSLLRCSCASSARGAAISATREWSSLAAWFAYCSFLSPGAVEYGAFLAAFLALSIGVLGRACRDCLPAASAGVTR